MGNYIDTARHKKAVRCVQILAYILLAAVLADVVLFVAYSLKSDSDRDSYVFFAVIFLSVLGSALCSAVGISLPRNGKFRYYRIPLHAFLISDIIGLAHGIRSITDTDKTFNEIVPLIYYTVFFAGCLIANILLLRYFYDSASKTAATIANAILLILVLLHMGDLIYTLINKDSFENSIPSKHNSVRLTSNSVFFLSAVSSMIVVRIKPKEKEVHDITEN